MQDHDGESQRRTGIREGFLMIAGATVLSPFLFLLVDLVPSRENTSLDELPYMAFTAALTGIALAGVARIGHALLTHKKVPELTSSILAEPLQPFSPEQRAPHAFGQPPRGLEHNTPV